MRKRKARQILDLALSGNTAARKAVKKSPTMRSELKTLETMTILLRHSLPCSAGDPCLAQRVTRRLKSSAHGEQLLYGSLLAVFRPVVAAVLLLIASLATYSVTLRSTDDIRPTTAEVVLGLEPVTLAEAFAADLETMLPTDP